MLLGKYLTALLTMFDTDIVLKFPAEKACKSLAVFNLEMEWLTRGKRKLNQTLNFQ